MSRAAKALGCASIEDVSELAEHVAHLSQLVAQLQRQLFGLHQQLAALRAVEKVAAGRPDARKLPRA